MDSDPFSIPTIGRFKCKMYSKFCCSPSKQENYMNMNNMNMNMEKWVVLQVTENRENYCLCF